MYVYTSDRRTDLMRVFNKVSSKPTNYPDKKIEEF